MKFRVNRLEASDNIRIAAIITGYEEILEGNDVESVFDDFRHFHADEGGFSWPLVAVDEDGEEYFDEGQEDKDYSHVLREFDNQIVGLIH